MDGRRTGGGGGSGVTPPRRGGRDAQSRGQSRLVLGHSLVTRRRDPWSRGDASNDDVVACTVPGWPPMGQAGWGTGHHQYIPFPVCRPDRLFGRIYYHRVRSGCIEGAAYADVQSRHESCISMKRTNR